MKFKLPIIFSLSFFIVASIFLGVVFVLNLSPQKSGDVLGVNLSPKNTNIIRIGNYDISLKIEKLSNVDLFKYVEKDVLDPNDKNTLMYANRDLDVSLEYYSVGDVVGGIYDGYKLIYAFDKTNSDSSPFVPAVFMSYHSQYVFFNSKSNIDQRFFNPSVSFDDDTSIYDYIFTNDLGLSTVSIKLNSDLSDDKYLKSKIINEVQVYSHKDDKNFIYTKTQEGFHKQYILKPDFYKTDDSGKEVLPEITWETGIKGENKFKYTFYSRGVCSQNVDYADVNKEDLFVVGKTVKGDNIYEFKNPAEDSFVKRIYEEDYPNLQLKNSLNSDDLILYSFDEIISHHPVFYWQNQMGRFIRSSNLDFVKSACE